MATSIEKKEKYIVEVSGAVTAVNTDQKVANYPTGFDNSNCYIEAMYMQYWDGSRYAMPNAAVGAYLSTDGIHLNVSAGSYVNQQFHFFLAKG